jgi:hypothetical protein
MHWCDKHAAGRRSVAGGFVESDPSQGRAVTVEGRAVALGGLTDSTPIPPCTPGMIAH